MIGYHQPDLSTSRKSISVKLIIGLCNSTVMHISCMCYWRVHVVRVRCCQEYRRVNSCFYEKCNRWLVRVSSFVIVWTKREQNFVSSSSTCNYTRKKQVDSRFAVVRFRESFTRSQTKLDPTQPLPSLISNLQN